MPTSTRSQSPTPSTAKPLSSQKVRGSAAKTSSARTPDIASGRAGSAGGIVLDGRSGDGKGKEKEGAKVKKGNAGVVGTGVKGSGEKEKEREKEKEKEKEGATRPRRKPRKLVREPVAEQPTAAAAKPASASASASARPATPGGTSAPIPSASELDALKSRVRGLEAKVEELYNTSSTRGSGRSPRRRGKGGRKGSSTTQIASRSGLKDEATRGEEEDQRPEEDEEEADEELTRAETELETARRDLALYAPSSTSRRPHAPRRRTTDASDDDLVEEIPRPGPAAAQGDTLDTSGRQVTLSGSYRIPLPSSVSMDDVRTIQSGVSAAQNVARSFLEQRRARMRDGSAEEPQPRPTRKPATSTPAPTATATPTAGAAKTKRKTTARPAPTTSNSSSGIVVSRLDEQGQGGKSWGEWFGGYSMAISRAVKNIEAEAVVESQKASGAASGAGGGKASAGAGRKSAAGTAAGSGGKGKAGRSAKG